MSTSSFRGAAGGVLLLAVALSACGSEADRDVPGSEAPPVVTAAGSPLEVAERTGVPNARMPAPGVVTAGQPTQRQLDALASAGVRHFISLRPPSESGAGWEEAHASGAGYDFDRIPVSGAASLTRENVEAFAALLDEAGSEPALVYCASSNRVGAMMALKAHWIDGVPAEEALELGRDAGLTRLEAPVRELLGLEG
ncbi:MAG: sulfur transferase domain-containing protein [Longimicrobiales bacterium]|nr:sulfur transferase domain-containing protein [Longimicrobiales bacterium]